MKLHLSKSLRAALLATFAVLAPLSLSLATATAADADSPREIRWDANWNVMGAEAYDPRTADPENSFTEIRVRQVESGGCGWNTIGGEYKKYYVVSLSQQTPGDPDAEPTTITVPAYAVAMNGVADPSGVLPTYNTAAGGYALTEPLSAQGARDYSIFMDISGTFEAVAGGDVYLYSQDWGTEETNSNHFIAIREGAKVGIVSAFNITKFETSRPGATTFAATLLGDSYVSVYTADVSAAVVGRTVKEASNCIGDSHVFIYSVLSQNTLANVHINTDAETIMWSSGDVYKPGCVAGGVYNAYRTRITGNSWVVVDLEGKTAPATFVKAVAGGSCNIDIHYQTGDAAVWIANSGGIGGFSAPVAGQSIYHNDSEWIGNSAVIIGNSSTKFLSAVTGGNYGELGYAGGADVRMWVGNGTTYLTPTLNYLNDSLDSLKLSYTELRNKWDGNDGESGGAADPAAATYNDTVVYIDKASGGAAFSQAVVGSNAFYSVTTDISDIDTTFVTDNGDGGANDGDKYLTRSPNLPPSLNGYMSVSYLREENSRSIVWIEGGSYRDMVVAGDYLYDTDNVEGAFYAPNNDNRYYVRHYGFRSSIGSTYLHTEGGTFAKQVQGGTYVYAQNYGGSAAVTHGGAGKFQEVVVSMRIKDINMELLGGTFGSPNSTAVLGAFDVTDTITSKDKPDVCLTSVVDAEVDSIYIQMGALDAAGAPSGNGVTVNGEIIGGSHIKSCIARNSERYAIRQGSVWLRLLNGQFNGNVYGAGFYDSTSGKYDYLTGSISTESVNIELSNQAEFGKIAISGSYKMSISSSSATPHLSVINGDKKLSFTSAGVYSNLSKITFADFSVVDVTDPAGYVTLSQPLQRLYAGSTDNCRKIGKGTLAFTNEHSSNASSFTVEAGTLVLAANSNNFETGMILGELSVRGNATLDISASSCGTRGKVVLGGDSSLKVSATQAPTRVTAIEWGAAGSGKVSVDSNIIPAKAYNVRLFDGLTTDKVSVFGQSLKTVKELGLSEKEVASLLGLDGVQSLADVYAIRAEDYVTLKAGGKEVSMDNAYLVLHDGVLSLATHIGREIAWQGGDGDSWNYVNPLFVSGDKSEQTKFHDADTIHFVATVDEPMTVVLDPGNRDTSNPGTDVIDNDTLAPYSIIVGAAREEGGTAVPSDFTFTAYDTDKTCKLDVKGSITVRNGSSLLVEESVGLVTYADHTTINVDNTSSLTIADGKVGVYTLVNGGMVDVRGDMEVNGSATSDGTLSVGGNLTLGSGVTYATFGDVLEVDGTLKFAEANTVAISGKASLGSAQGGTLLISGGTADDGEGQITTFSLRPLADEVVDGVTLEGNSTLKALQGSGTLTVNNGAELTLQSKSNIGDLLAGEGSVQLYDKLGVDGKLKARAVTFASVGNGVINDNAVTAGAIDCGSFELDDRSFKDIHFVSDGAKYTLVKGESLLADLKINREKEKADFRNGRFYYHAHVEGNTIMLDVENASPDYYAEHATTQNGKAGAASLDSLFSPDVMDRIAKNNNALASVIIAMDNMVGAGNADADKLAAAAAGASNAALGCALSDDVHRQLKAIRNRTTMMGCAECETHEDIPTFNAWINAEGNYHKLDSDGTFAGYTLSSWGGTVGVDVDFSEHLTVGLAVSALYGDYSANSPDTVEGDLDTQYLTLFARYAARAWVHTFVATVGRADASVKRTVAADGVAYTNEADTDGTGFGLMYEVGRVFAVSEDASACIEPVVNFTLLKSTVGGFTETGTDAVVKTDDLEMTRFIIGAGARMQGIVGETVYNRTSILEGRALLKANLGDNSCEAGNRFVIGGMGGTYESAEQGSVGLEIGIGITVPVGGAGSSVFADFSADINSGYSNINGTVGYRINF